MARDIFSSYVSETENGELLPLGKNSSCSNDKSHLVHLNSESGFIISNNFKSILDYRDISMLNIKRRGVQKKKKKSRYASHHFSTGEWRPIFVEESAN